MSIENHPNLHAAGLVVDLYAAIDKRLRGEALAAKPIILGSPRLSKMIEDFVNKLDDDLDELMRILKRQDPSFHEALKRHNNGL